MSDPIIHTNCCVCQVQIYMPQSWYDEYASKTDRWFYCTNGHKQHFTGPTPLQKERDALKAKLERAERDRDAAVKARQQVERDRDGKCNLCGRTFDGVRGLKMHRARVHFAIKRLPANAGGTTP